MGTMVTLRGSGFTHSTSVRFGKVAAIKTTYVGSTEVKAEVPSGITCAVTVSFTENGLTNRSSPDDAFHGSVCTVPRALTKLTAFAGDAEARVSYEPPSGNGGAKITSYVVTAYDETRPGHGGQTATGTSSPITVQGLRNGDLYSFTVRATNMVGTGPASEASETVKSNPTFEVWTPSLLPKATWSHSCSDQLQTSGASPGATITWKATSLLPFGLSLSASGTLSGTPTTKVSPAPQLKVKIPLSVTETVNGVQTTVTRTLLLPLS